MSALAGLALLWLTYFFVHSLFATDSCKGFIAAKIPVGKKYYRLLYNLLAILLVIPPVWMTYSLAGDLIISWHGSWRWLSYLLTVVAIAGFLWSLRYYDSAEFLGLKQLNGHQESDDRESFVLSPLHRYVRHPWYSLALLLIWTRDMDTAMLLSAVLITLYFIIGSRLEEAKLVMIHGENYQHYRQLVAGLIPLPWKILSRERAKELLL